MSLWAKCTKCGQIHDLSIPCNSTQKPQEQMNMAEKYPLTEQEHPLKETDLPRCRYTLSGWIRLIKVNSNEEENQLLDRMWEDKEYDSKIREEYKAWQEEEPQTDWRMQPVEIDPDNKFCSTEEYEDRLRVGQRKSIRSKGWKGHQRGKQKRREA